MDNWWSVALPSPHLPLPRVPRPMVLLSPEGISLESQWSEVNTQRPSAILWALKTSALRYQMMIFLSFIKGATHPFGHSGRATSAAFSATPIPSALSLFFRRRKHFSYVYFFVGTHECLRSVYVYVYVCVYVRVRARFSLGTCGCSTNRYK